MIHRVAGVLLVVALGSSAGVTPFARVRMNLRTPRHRLLVGRAVRRIAEPAPVQVHGHAPVSNTLVDYSHHQLSVVLATVAVEHPSVRVGVTPALVGVSAARIVPDLPSRSVPVTANARSNRPPRVVLTARAPPV